MRSWRQGEAGLAKAVDLGAGPYPAATTDLEKVTSCPGLHFFVSKMEIIILSLQDPSKDEMGPRM